MTDVYLQVCVRGLKAIPLSLDLWIHYITLLQDTLNMNLPESTQHIRRSAPACLTATLSDQQPSSLLLALLALQWDPLLVA